MDSTNHDHCGNCFKMQCDLVACPLTLCDKGCGFRMHLCKISDHINQTCQKTRVPCPNADYGCLASMPRESVKNHLKSCPASVVFCTMEWRRYPVFSKYRLNWVPFFQPNPVLVKGDLDVELAVRDQRVLADISRQRMRKGKMKVDIERRRLSDVSASAKQRDKSRVDMKDRSEVIKIGLARSEKLNSLKAWKSRKASETGDDEGNGAIAGRGKDILRSDCDIQTAKEVRETETVSLKPKFDIASENAEGKLLDDHESTSCAPPQEGNLHVPPPPDCVPLYLDRPLGLNVMIESLPKFMKQVPMYSIPCNQVFRRDEYTNHFRNVHNDIHGGLNGWLQHRCPLAQYGCTFVSYRFRPHRQSEQLLFSQELGSFGVKPHAEPKENETATPRDEREKPGAEYHPENTSDGTSCNEPTDLLTAYLPVEILMNIVSRLDGFSLRNFSCTCKRFREVCRELVTKRGMVLLDWEQIVRENGKSGWRVKKKKWSFSTSFTPVDEWVHTDDSFMAAHVEKCPYFDRYLPPKVINYSKLGSTSASELLERRYAQKNGGGSFLSLMPVTKKLY